MAEYFYDNHKPVYRNTNRTSSIKLDSSNNQLIITNSNIPKTIIINSEEFSNGIQSLPYIQMYENINAVNACVFPAPNSTTLKVNDTIELNDGSNNALIGIDPSGNLLIDPSKNIIMGSRTYQELNSGSTWNAVNGYYGLSKDAYPALNPSSSGVQAVSTWTSRTSSTINIRGIAWSPQLKLFVGMGGLTALTSSDGFTWTATPNLPNNLAYRSVCWSPELSLFVAVASSGTQNQKIITSSDGITWTTRNAPNNNTWWSVCWSAELGIFVIVGGSDNGTSTSNRILTSSDGITWSQQTNPLPAPLNPPWFRSVCWSPELSLFVAVSQVGFGGSNYLATSPNGIDWTTRTINTSPTLNSVCWSAELGLFVAVSKNEFETPIYTSSNGIVWTARGANLNNNNDIWGSVCWSAELGLFVAIMNNVGIANDIATSSNGINWVKRPTGVVSQYECIIWSPEMGIFVAGSIGGQRIVASSLAGRPPTSYNVFDSSFNNIDSSGNWTLKSKSIFSDGNITIDPSNTLIVLGNLDMSLNNITNVNDLTLKKNNMALADNLLINFNRDNETRAYVWYQNSNSSPIFPEMLRFGSGSGRTSWTIALRDPNGVSNNQVNQLSYGYFGWDPTSLFAINYDDIPNFNGQSITNIFRLQVGGTNLSQLLYTKDGKLSIGNSYTDVSNNGGYRLDINGKSLFRNDIDLSLNNITRVSNISNTSNITIDPSNTLIIEGILDMSNNIIRNSSSFVAGSSSINSSAVLQADSTTKGFLPPRMTSTQANAIVTPAEGLMIYVTDTGGSPFNFTSKGWWGYDGSTWTQLG